MQFINLTKKLLVLVFQTEVLLIEKFFFLIIFTFICISYLFIFIIFHAAGFSMNP